MGNLSAHDNIKLLEKKKALPLFLKKEATISIFVKDVLNYVLK